METPTILEVNQLRKSFDGLLAVYDVSFQVKAGQIKTIIGPNGAGKTTVFNLVSGFLPPTSGDVKFKGKSLKGLKPDAVARLGLSRTFQIVRLFGDLTVLENVMVGYHRRAPASIWECALGPVRTKRAENNIREQALRWLEFVGLGDRARDYPPNLPFGQQRLLELARALAGEPELLLLDEPAAGLNDAERQKLGNLLLNIREQGGTILLVEHNMDLVMSVSDEILVVNYGQKLAEGTAEQIQRQEEVIAAYLGEVE
ncbi:MAG: ABC transporter ATP-binding protein [Dehalococcoidales bacterium]|nr:ABC transporter ATP-binding protein [Dehalococcoidales bacterium]